MIDTRIQLRTEKARGCGYRTKKGALYLVDFDMKDWHPCGKLPLEVGICPTCGTGIRVARQFVWVDADRLLERALERKCKLNKCSMSCPLSDAAKHAGFTIGNAGLIWVGEKFYETPDAFMDEAAEMGISRRINFVPKGFEIGKSYILLGHIHAIPSDDEATLKGLPGIITMFKPKAIEVICDGTETAEVIDGYEKRGLTPVLVEKYEAPLEEQSLLNLRETARVDIGDLHIKNGYLKEKYDHEACPDDEQEGF